MTLQGDLRSLILAPIECAHAASYWSSIVTLVLSCPVSEILQFFLLRATPLLFHPNFTGVPLGLDCRCCGSEEGYYYRKWSVRPSVRLSVYDVDVSWAYRLD